MSEPPPPPLANVVSVTVLDATHANWRFDEPVTWDGIGPEGQLRIAGAIISNNSQVAADTIGCFYFGAALAPGQAWSIIGACTRLSPVPVVPQAGLTV